MPKQQTTKWCFDVKVSEILIRKLNWKRSPGNCIVNHCWLTVDTKIPKSFVAKNFNCHLTLPILPNFPFFVTHSVKYLEQIWPNKICCRQISLSSFFVLFTLNNLHLKWLKKYFSSVFLNVKKNNILNFVTNVSSSCQQKLKNILFFSTKIIAWCLWKSFCRCFSV